MILFPEISLKKTFILTRVKTRSIPVNNLSFPQLTFAEDINLVIYMNITIIPPINRIVTTKNAHEILLTPRTHLTKKAEQMSLDMAIYGELVSPVIREPTIKKYTHIILYLIENKVLLINSYLCGENTIYLIILELNSPAILTLYLVRSVLLFRRLFGLILLIRFAFSISTKTIILEFNL